MDQQSTIAAFSHLIQQYPDLNMTIVSDVLQACDQDIDRAYATLCEMVIPPEHSISTPPKPSPPHPSTPVRFAFPPQHTEDCDTTSPTQPPVLSSSPRTVSPPQPQGAWARNNMGRRLRVDEMCNKYTWIRRSVVEDLFHKNADCIELVENDILRMFPIDQPTAFASSTTSPIPTLPQSPRQRIIAESLRAQAADEIRRTAACSEKISMASPEMCAMRQQLWQTRETCGDLHLLAARTRKQAHIDNAKQKDDELQRLSAAFLANIRQSEEYRNGVVDLHGLTKEEAIQIVEWKLKDGGRKRFRLITGKGNHSHNYQAVLKPTLEKHFRSKRVSFTHIQDGVLSVSFP